jgi:hypothetical protein
MTRALRCDGVVPYWQLGGRDGTPDDLREMRAWLAERGAPDIDVVTEGETPAGDPAAAAAHVAPWAEAGATWWLETLWGATGTVDQRTRQVTDRIAAGPPRV